MKYEHKPRGSGCCPSAAGTYRAFNKKLELEVVGTAREVGEETGIDAGRVRFFARTGRKSKEGWAVELLKPSVWTGKVGRRAVEYIAENPNEDPIVGPPSEIAALTGMDVSSVWYHINTGTKTRSGWVIRPVDAEDPTRV